MLHGYIPLLLEGLRTTLAVAFCAYALAILFGLMGAAGKLRGGALGRTIATSYTVLTRGIPELVLLLLVYFGLPSAVQTAIRMLGPEYAGFRLELPAFEAGVLALGFVYGGYATDVIRGAVQSIPRGQIEAGYAYGMRGWVLFRRVVFGQMLRFALPGLGNLWLVLLKATSLVSVLQLNELMRAANLAAANTAEPFTFYLAAVCIYLGLTAISLALIKLAERHAFVGERVAA
jgi:polar amino acid transport system permease protein/octopine/nopaline transport system permease protein/arginine/ornithine transport system permease protein